MYKRVSMTSFFYMAQQSLVGYGLLVIAASRSPSDTLHAVGLLWTSDQPDADQRLTKCGHWDRLI